MGFVKLVKTKAYFKRFQVKYRRRREGKTDYYARRKLIVQDKYKYNSPKFRFVVRFTNTDVITQLVEARIEGDIVLVAAYAHELNNYGLPFKNNNNYASAYATGLLLARRVLNKYGLDSKYEGNKTPTGEDFNVSELEDGPRPFYALLDVGLRRTTTGSKVFAALKGATDGGMNIPHSEKRFVGYDREEKKLKAEVLRKYIFGGHVADYMTLMKGEDQQKYEKTFTQYLKAGIKPEGVEALWTKVHAAIRANPAKKTKAAEPSAELKKKTQKKVKTKLSYAQRKDKIKQKLASIEKKKASE